MPQNHKHKSEQGSSLDEAALRTKRERVFARSDRYASTLVAESIFKARLTYQLPKSGYPAQQQSLLALASTIFDGIDEDPDRRLGKQVRDGAKQRGAETREKAAERHRKWQELAEEIWARQPSLSKSVVASIIARQISDNPNTIRRHIQSPYSQT